MLWHLAHKWQSIYLERRSSPASQRRPSSTGQLCLRWIRNPKPYRPSEVSKRTSGMNVCLCVEWQHGEGDIIWPVTYGTELRSKYTHIHAHIQACIERSQASLDKIPNYVGTQNPFRFSAVLCCSDTSTARIFRFGSMWWATLFPWTYKCNGMDNRNFMSIEHLFSVRFVWMRSRLTRSEKTPYSIFLFLVPFFSSIIYNYNMCKYFRSRLNEEKKILMQTRGWIVMLGMSDEKK